MTKILANHVLAKKYRLLRRLNGGGESSIWQAEQLVNAATVAIKVLSTTYTSTSRNVETFLTQAREAQFTDRKNILRILDYGVDNGTAFVAMEFLRGESVSTRLAREGTLTFKMTQAILLEVSSALSAAYRSGGIELDLKPSNIFLARTDLNEEVKLLNFGIRKAPSTLPFGGAKPSSPVGSPFYASPEQTRIQAIRDQRADVWSLGVIAFECLTGSRPFQADSKCSLADAICLSPLPIPSQVGRVPPPFDQWFARACCRSPKHRFQSLEQAASELKAIARITTHPLPELELPSLPTFKLERQTPHKYSTAKLNLDYISGGGRRSALSRRQKLYRLSLPALGLVALLGSLLYPSGPEEVERSSFVPMVPVEKVLGSPRALGPARMLSPRKPGLPTTPAAIPSPMGTKAMNSHDFADPSDVVRTPELSPSNRARVKDTQGSTPKITPKQSRRLPTSTISKPTLKPRPHSLENAGSRTHGRPAPRPSPPPSRARARSTRVNLGI